MMIPSDSNHRYGGCWLQSNSIHLWIYYKSTQEYQLYSTKFNDTYIIYNCSSVVSSESLLRNNYLLLIVCQSLLD